MLLSRPVLRRVAGATAAALAVGIVPFVAAAPTASAAPSELFISEYIEGSSNNKALEIYNGTGATIDLATGGYNVQVFANGATAATSTINLAGSVTSGDVFVLANSSAIATIISVSDQTSGSANWNGDDAVVLRKGTAVIDVLGQVGFRPVTEWGTGLVSTADNTLRRKSSVTAGDTNGGDAFDPSLQWDGYATDTVDGLGSHTVDGGPATDVAPAVASTTPVDGAKSVVADASPTVTFSEPVNTGSGAFALSCTLSGPKTLDVTGGPTTFTLDPSADFAPGDACTLTVKASDVTDQDAIDPPDNLASDVVVRFSVPDVNPCEVTATPVPAIQGSGATAAITGTVTTRGVVVGDYEGASPALRGFFIQDPLGDGNPATSDGIFVFEGSGADSVKLGDLVTVTGTAGENQGQTQITLGSSGVLTVCGTGTVAPTEVTFPVADATFLERFEGMLVTLPQEMAVTEHFQLGRFGQVTLAEGGRLEQPTNVAAPGDAAAAVQTANTLRKIILDDTSQAQNVDPIIFGRGGKPLTASNTLRGGDTVTGLTGVLNYTWAGNSASGNAYRIRPVSPLATVDFAPTNPRPSSAPAVGGDTRIVGMNLLNFFNTLDTTGNNCRGGLTGAVMGCRGANTAAEFDRQWAKTVTAVSGTQADVVAFMEMENDG
jgi:predicted extracellular nuclease